MINPNDLRTAEFLIQSSLQELYLKWAATQPLRSGLHASSLLVPPGEWCTRRFVLAEIAPSEAVQPELHYWDWRMQSVFENGWDLHRRWQKLFLKFANVVWSPVIHAQDQIADAKPELDLTHHDVTRNIYFSPDAIIDYAGVRYVVEIKGLDTNKFQQLTDNLDTACKVSDVVAKARIQCNLYCHLLEIEYGFLLIEDKNSQQFKVWIIQCDAELAKPYIQRAYDVKGRVALFRRSRQLPERVCKSSDDRLAQKCPMRNCCFSEKMEG